jgi:hypothetical protein
MIMTHSVIAKDKTQKIIQVITCFSKEQIPIAKRQIISSFPDTKLSFTVKSSNDHYEDENRK